MPEVAEDNARFAILCISGRLKGQVWAAAAETTILNIQTAKQEISILWKVLNIKPHRKIKNKLLCWEQTEVWESRAGLAKRFLGVNKPLWPNRKWNWKALPTRGKRQSWDVRPLSRNWGACTHMSLLLQVIMYTAHTHTHTYAHMELVEHTQTPACLHYCLS